MAGIDGLLALLGGALKAAPAYEQQKNAGAVIDQIGSNSIPSPAPGSALPQSAPQSPMPGQASVPMSRPVPTGQPQQQAPVQPAPTGVPAGNMVPQAPPQQLSLPQLIQSLKQRGLSGNQILQGLSNPAVQQVLSNEGKQQYQSLLLNLKQSQLEERERNDMMRAGIAQQNANANSTRAGASKENADINAQWKQYKESNPNVNTKAIDAQDKVIANQLKEITGRNGGMIPPPGTADGQEYNDLLKKRTALAQKKVQLIGQDNIGTDTNTPAGQDNGVLIQQAKEAIAGGADRNAVINRLKEMGVDAGGL